MGIDVDGISDQFAIMIGTQRTSISRDSAPTAVSLTGSGTNYTATVSLPQTSYPTLTELNLATQPNQFAFSSITTIDNSPIRIMLSTDNPIDTSGSAVILTDHTNNYEFDTGARTLERITSRLHSDDNSRVIYTLAFGSRINSLAASNLSLTRDDGSILTGTPSMTIVAISPTPRRSVIYQTGTFSHYWRITTDAIANNESPRLTLINLDGVTFEGASGQSIVPTDGTETHIHSLIADVPIVSNISRIGDDIETTGGADDKVAWNINFNQFVINVDASDFQIVDSNDIPISDSSISVHANDSDDSNLVQASNFTIEATLPDTNHSFNTQVNLRIIGTNDIEGSEAPIFADDLTPTRRRFGVAKTLTSSSSGTNFLLNTDTDSVTMSISRHASTPREHSPRVDGNPHEVSWTITFSESVEGVDVRGVSDQFAIKIGDQDTGISHETVVPAFTDVSVTGFGDTYTATVALPQSSYPDSTILNLTTADTEDALSSIKQLNNFNDNGVVISDSDIDITQAGESLTTETNDYVFSTGSKTLLSITSATQADRSVIYTMTYGVRVRNISNDFALTRDDGTSSLTGSPTMTFAPVAPSPSRVTTLRNGEIVSQGDGFSYIWTATTTPIEYSEIPRLTYIRNDASAESPSGFTTLSIPTDGTQTYAHSFPATAPIVSTVTRTKLDIETVGGTLGVIGWHITFNQPVINVDEADFRIVNPDGDYIIGSTFSVRSYNDARTFTITAALPETSSYISDTEVNLGIDTTDIMGSEGPTSSSDSTIRRVPFGAATTLTSSTHTPPTHYLYNPDIGPLVMTIARTDDVPRSQTSRVSTDSPVQVSWTITFDAPVTGIDVDGVSDQFAIKLGEQAVGESLDTEISTDVLVTGSGDTYTATVNLPQVLYYDFTTLNLTTAGTTNVFSPIRQMNSFLDNRLESYGNVDISNAGEVLTDDTNNYVISTGSRMLTSITSATGPNYRTAVFTLTFGTRIADLRDSNIALRQADGTTLLTGAPTFTIARVGAGAPSRFSTGASPSDGFILSYLDCHHHFHFEW